MSEVRPYKQETRDKKQETSNKKAICLLSGGLDSTTALYWARREGYEVYALTVQYGQLHKKEVRHAAEIVRPLGIEHHVIEFTMPWGGSSLIDASTPIPQKRDESRMQTEIPSTYVPARNTIFLSLAVSYAEAAGAKTILIGANAIDYSGYPDCRPEYLQSFEKAVRLGTRAGVDGNEIKVLAPLLYLSKKEIVLLAKSLDVPFEKTWSCYEGGEVPCGTCDACRLRAKGFEEAGFCDPAMRDAGSLRT